MSALTIAGAMMSPNDQERIAGAKAVLDAIMNRKLFKPVSRHNFEENRAKFESDMATLIEEVGEVPPLASGAISLLAELIAEEIGCGNFDYRYFEGWKAEATMTPSEIAKHRATVKAEDWCEEETPARCSVVSLAERRAAS
jgi:hypothetical protein